MLQIMCIAALLLATSHGDVSEDTCPAEPWEAALEDWVTAERGNLTRHGRIMSLAPTQGYYVSDRIDLVPPPPPHGPHSPHVPHGHMLHRGPYPAAPTQHHQTHHGPHGPAPGQPGPPPGHSYNQGGQQNHGSQPGSYQPSPGPNQSPPPSGSSYHQSSGSTYGPPAPAPQAAAPQQYDEWRGTPPPPPGAGKIVNKPPNPYKDQFKPSYAPPAPPIPVSDRVDGPPPGAGAPQKAVSETDLYLLRAIEKLVYRADLMEKRMRKMEENMHYIVAGAPAKPDPCDANFTRVGASCYYISSEAVNWKSASYACRKLKANLLELDADEKRRFLRALREDNILKGADVWTGGLNPGLLWIWSHSAKPVADNSTEQAGAGSSGISGEGRCLALVAPTRAPADYTYQGQDCALRHRYVCERDDDTHKLGNEIERVAKSLREGKRKPKIALDLL